MEPEQVLHAQSTGEDSEAAADAGQRSRRRFFFLGTLAAATTLLPRRLRAQRRPRQGSPTRPQQEVVPVSASQAPAAWATNVVRLVRRATMGVSASEVALARQMGYQGYLNYQLNHTRIPDDAVATAVATRWPLLQQTGLQIYNQNLGTLLVQLQEGTLYRAAFSRRQLYERMVEFWTDHFSIYMGDVGYLKVLDDRDVIRKHALGRFPDLLRASTRSAAMLSYLDQNLSRVGRPNENYARELMELHTLGVDGGYTQQDVAELARVLTGWTVQGRGDFVFNPSLHDWGSKTVLGVTIPAGSPSMGADGIKEGEQIIDLLVKHPNTARYIAKKMLQWLLTPEPSETQVSTIASVYRVTGGDIKAMVRAILNEGWVAAAPAKFKRPFHFLVSAVRATNATTGANQSLNRSMTGLGQSLFLWETPDGFPDKMEYWVGGVLSRWNYASTLAASTGTALTVNIAPFVAGSPDATLDIISTNMFGGEMPDTTRAMLSTYLRAGTYGTDRVRETVALALSSSAFQLY